MRLPRKILGGRAEDQIIPQDVLFRAPIHSGGWDPAFAGFRVMVCLRLVRAARAPSAWHRVDFRRDL